MYPLQKRGKKYFYFEPSPLKNPFSPSQLSFVLTISSNCDQLLACYGVVKREAFVNDVTQVGGEVILLHKYAGVSKKVILV